MSFPETEQIGRDRRRSLSMRRSPLRFGLAGYRFRAKPKRLDPETETPAREGVSPPFTGVF